MKKEKESPLKAAVQGILTFLLMLFCLAMIFMPFASLGMFLEGYTKIGAVLLGIFILQIIIVVVYFKHDSKTRKAKEEAYRAENVSMFEIDCGRLGMLTVEYDKVRNVTTLNNGFPAIFSDNEVPQLNSYGEALSGRKVERIADRLIEDRDRIIEKVTEKYNMEIRTKDDPDITGLSLDEISIEDSGETVVCSFEVIGNPHEGLSVNAVYYADKEKFVVEMEEY
ncbi:MAG: hypothetical protein IKO27_02375 [Ruminococcus sp.]|nr:hypothetical protein [Ruminococcus sp.]